MPTSVHTQLPSLALVLLQTRCSAALVHSIVVGVGDRESSLLLEYSTATMRAALLGSSPRLDPGRLAPEPLEPLGPGPRPPAGVGPLDGGRARAVLGTATGPLDGGRAQLCALPAPAGDARESPRGPSARAPSPRLGGRALCDNLGGGEVACDSCSTDHDETYAFGCCGGLRFVLGGVRVRLSRQSVETRASCSAARGLLGVLLGVPAGVPVGVLVGVCT